MKASSLRRRGRSREGSRVCVHLEVWYAADDWEVLVDEQGDQTMPADVTWCSRCCGLI